MLACCVERYGQQIQILEQIIQQELGTYQNRLQRCFADCSDAASDKFPDHATNPAASEKARQFMLSGASQCADKHIAMLKGVQAKIESDLDELVKRSK